MVGLVYVLLVGYLASAGAARPWGQVGLVVLGSLLVLRWPALLWLHVVAVLWAAATMTLDLGCVLTPWEKSLWRSGGREPYAEGFVQHHVLRADLSPARSRLVHVALGLAVLALNVVVYLAVFNRRA